MVTNRALFAQVIKHTWAVGWKDLREQCFPLFKSDQQCDEGVIKCTLNRLAITILGAMMFAVYWSIHTVKSIVYTLALLDGIIFDRIPFIKCADVSDSSFPTPIKQVLEKLDFEYECLYFPHAHLTCLILNGRSLTIFSNFKEFEEFVKQI